VATPSSTGLDLMLLDRRSSIPLATAVVNLLSHDRLTTAQADVHGKISLDLPEGSYDLMVAAKGYMSALFRGLGVVDGRRVEVIRGLDPGGGRSIEELPAGSIGGLIIDRLDQPVTNIIVQAASAQNNYTTRSDKTGCYVLNNVIPGEYEIVWRAGDRALNTEKLKLGGPRLLLRHDVRLIYL